MDFDKIILRAIPKNDKCAIEESYNKVRRKWLKEQIDLYIEEKIAGKISNGLGESADRPLAVSQV